MRLGQIKFEGKITAAVFEGPLARPVPGYNLVELIRKAETESVALTTLAAEMASHHGDPAAPVLPINPLEVWACGCTYAGSNGRCPVHLGEAPDFYQRAFQHVRPQIFFKGTARVCVGPGQPIGIRFDSSFTVPEPELALVLGRKGRILGYTLGNDVTARDIQRENPLYHPQAKTYSGSCALGPLIVTADELAEPYQLVLTCSITRAGEPRFLGSFSTAGLRHTLEVLVEYALRANPLPAGSVLLTGTGVALTEAAALAPGDVVWIGIPEIGELSNPAAIVQ
jgi:2-dehydro-3-deoxy-D-arabinonate dehydratase